MGPAEAALIAASIWFAVYLGYVLLAGMGMFWAIVWPDGHDVRRLRMVAVVGLSLIGLGAVAETAVDWLTQGHAFAQLPAFGETVLEQSAMWLLLRLAALAVVGFFGAELLRRPVRGVRRIIVLTLVGFLTVTLVVESTAMDLTPGRRDHREHGRLPAGAGGLARRPGGPGRPARPA